MMEFDVGNTVMFSNSISPDPFHRQHPLGPSTGHHDAEVNAQLKNLGSPSAVLVRVIFIKSYGKDQRGVSNRRTTRRRRVRTYVCVCEQQFRTGQRTNR